MDALVGCLDSLGDSLGRVILRHVAKVAWKVSVTISGSLLLFYQDEDTKQDNEEGEEAATRCSPRDEIAASGESCCTVPGKISPQVT